MVKNKTMNSTQVKVLPNSDDQNDFPDQRFSSEKQEEKAKNYVKVPPYHKAMLHMFNASWLTVNDDDEFDCNKSFVDGNLNLSLICALLFTTFMPLYFNEASRLDDINDGLTIDLAMGYLSPLVLSKEFIHDLFDTAYLVATAGTLFGTMVAVFYMLAANEATDDRKTFVLMRHLGGEVSQLPYFFFSIGIFGWAFGAMFHVFVTPRTASGFYVKVCFLWGMILLMILICFPRMIIGVFRGRLEEQKHPPLFVPVETIKQRLEVFLGHPEQSGDISLRTFLQSLSYITEYHYRPGLNPISELHAKRLYYEKLAEITGCTVKEVKETIKH
jgi:hypothetical protein